jgi:hypothetical protein
MSSKELLPCPVCGSEAKYVNSEGHDYIFCDECGARTFGFNKEHAFDEWNKRAKYVNNVNNESNYLEKQDSSNVEQSVQVPEVVENGSCKYLPDECCEKSCKEENATFKPLIPKWTKYSDKTLILNVNFMQCAYVEFHITNVKNKYRLTAFLKSNDSYYNEEDGGIFTTIEEAKEKANDYIKWIGERLVCFAENIKTEE